MAVFTLSNRNDKKNGTQSADSISGLAGNDTLAGLAGDDTLLGGEGNDSLNGGTDNDRLQGGTGNDTLIGGTGSDQALYAGNVADYTYSVDTDGKTWIVKDVYSGDGDDGTDRLTGIEMLSFADGTVVLPSLSLSATSVIEGDQDGQTALVTVNLSEKSLLPVTVNYKTLNGTALAGSDYTASKGILTFNPGEISQTFSVPILGDTRVENDEVFQIQLLNPAGATLGTTSSAGITIQDDDALSLLISSDKTLLKSGDTATIQFAFSDVPKGFTQDDVITKGGSLSNFAMDTSGQLYTALFTPTPDTNKLAATISVPAGRYSNAIGKPGPAGNVNLNGDTQGPGLKITSDKTQFIAGDTALITFTFTEPPLGFASNDVKVTGGTLGVLQTDASRMIYTALFTPAPNLSNPAGNISVASGAYTDAIRNPGLAASLQNLDIQTPVPTVSITGTTLKEGDSGTTNASLTVTLSAPSNQPVSVGYTTVDGTALARSDYTRTTGILNFAKGQTSQTITIPILGDTLGEDDETFQVQLNRPARCTTSRTNDIATVTIQNDDPLTPTLTLSSDKTAFKAGDTTKIHFAFSTVPVGFNLDKISVSGGTLSSPIADDTSKLNYTAIFTPDKLTEKQGSLSLKDESYTDTGGKPGTVINTLAFTVDTQSPSVVITTDKLNFKAGETAPLTFTFSETPSGFSVEDISITGGKISNLQVPNPANSTVYTGDFTPDIQNNLTATLSVIGKSYTDILGNAGFASNTVTLSGDTKAPGVTISGDKTLFRIGETANITFKFDESPLNFTLDDINGPGTFSGLQVDGTDNTLYRAVFTPTPGTNMLNGLINVADGGFTDNLGNPGKTSNKLAITGDTLAPSLTISSDRSQFKAGDTANLTFSFSEPVVSFSQDAVNISGGSLGNLITNDNRVWTGVFTPAGNANNLAVTVTVGGEQYKDKAGNIGQTSTALTVTGKPLTIGGDTNPPGLTITPNKTTLKAGETATLTFTFTEPVQDFMLNDISTTDGTVSALALSPTDSKTYTATYTPKANNTSQNGTVSVAAGSYTDVAGNSGLAASLAQAITMDTQPPGLTISSDKTTYKAGDTATLTFTFTEPPTGFTVSDITVTGGTLLGTLAPLDPKTNSTSIQFLPNVSDTWTSTLAVAANTYGDAQGNNGLASNTLTLQGDTHTPSLTISSSNKTTVKSGDTPTLTFTFSELVTGFTLADIANNTTIGTVSGLVASPDGKVYTASYTPKPGQDSSSDVITVATLDSKNAPNYTDPIGNKGLADVTLNLAVDTKAPSLTIKSNGLASAKGTDTALVTFTFSETPSGFDTSDIKASGGTVGTLVPLGAADSKVYTAIFTPAAATPATSSTVRSIGVANGSYTDTAGNPGGGYSIQAPGLTVSSNRTTFKVDETAVITFTFSDDPGSSFTQEDIIANGGTLSTITPTGLIRTATFTPANTNTLAGSISVAANTYTDSNGNMGSASNSLTLTGDTQAPTLAITSSASSLKIGDLPATLTFTFSEPVAGFTATDITTNNNTGTLGALTASADKSIYTAIFTPKTNQDSTATTFTVADKSYTDVTGNNGTGSNTSVTVDTRAPTLMSKNTVTVTDIDGKLVLTFNENVQAVSATTAALSTGITLTNTLKQPINTPEFTYPDSDSDSDSNKTITVTPTPPYWLSNATYTLTFEAGSLRDTAGNLNDRTVVNFTLPLDTTPPLLLLNNCKPLDGTTNVSINFGLPKPLVNNSGDPVFNAIDLVFNEPIRYVSGLTSPTLYIKNSNNPGDNRAILLADPDQCTFDGRKLSIKSKVPLLDGSEYYIYIDYGLIEDYSGNKFRGITDPTTLNFSTRDGTPPVLSSSIPADNAIGVAIDSNLTLSFNETVKAGTGYITLVNAQDTSKTIRINITDSSQISFVGSNITINPSARLVGNSSYSVTIDNGAIKDMADNAFGGITDTATLSFTTFDNTLRLTNSIPQNGDSNVLTDGKIKLTFSNPVQAGIGSITLSNITLSNGTDIRTINVADTSRVSIANNLVTIDPRGLSESSTYAVSINSGVFLDGQGNVFAGIDTNHPLNFSTINYTPALIGFSSDSSNRLTLTFSEPVFTPSIVPGNMAISDSSSKRIIKSSEITINGNQVTIVPNPALATGHDYNLELYKSAFEDSSHTPNEGISFNFTTPDSQAPSLNTSGTFLAALDENLVLQFSEPVTGTGSVSIKDSNGGNSRSINLDPGWFSGNALSLSLPSGLQPGISYLVDLTNATIRDLSGNLLTTTTSSTWATLKNSSTLPTTPNSSATSGADTLYSSTSNDTLDGLAGNDTLYGGDGSDMLFGGEGNDQLYGGNHVDTLNGGPGDDILYGEAGNDSLSGGTGNDSIFGGSGDDALSGDDGDDWLQGGAGKDTLYGGNGNDTLMTSSFASDTTGEFLFGGAGNDFLLGNAYSDDSLSGDDGADTLEGAGRNDTLSGSLGDDSLLGGTGADSLDGGDGNDTLMGGDDNDTLNGGNGNDLLRGGTGDDTLTGGMGDDTLKGEDGNDVIDDGYGRNWIDAGDGDDTIRIGAYAPVLPSETYNLDALADTDRTTVAGRGGQDTYVLYGYGAQAIVTDFAVANDRIDISNLLARSVGYNDGNPFGSPGYFRLKQDGLVTLLQWDRDGAAGSNFAWQTGIRLLNVTASSLTINNFIPFVPPDGSTVGLSLTGTAGADTLNGSLVNDTLDGGAGNDRITGLSGDDSLVGGSGNDTLDGGSGNDTLSGGSGNDSLIGGSGDDNFMMESYLDTTNDVLDGGIGNDTLTLSSIPSSFPNVTNVTNIEALAITGANPLSSFTNSSFTTFDLLDSSTQSLKLDTNYTSTLTTVKMELGDTLINTANVDLSIILPGVADLDTATTITGGSGNDTLTTTGGGTATLTHISGIETITLLNPAIASSTTLITSDNNVASNTTLTVDASQLDTGSTLTFNGSSEADGKFNISGGAGNDTLTGGAGNDTFVYSSLSYFMTNGAIIDSLTGGNGTADAIQIGGAITMIAGDSLARANTIEKLVAATAATGSPGLAESIVLNSDAAISSIRTIDLSGETGASSTGVINLSGITAAITGMTLKGVNGGGNNTLTGGAGVDSITGGSGADTITGGLETDNLSGGAGADVFLIGAAAEYTATETLNGGAGADTLRFTSTTPNETLTLNSLVTDSDNTLSVVISDASGATTGTTALNVSAAAVTLTGGVTMIGNSGNNNLTGSAYNDTITGGSGADTINAGSGTDRVVIAAGDISSTTGSATATVFAVTGDVISGLTNGNGSGDVLDLDAVSPGSLAVASPTDLTATGAINFSGSTGVLVHNAPVGVTATNAVVSGVIQSPFITAALAVITTTGAGTNSATTSDGYVAIYDQGSDGTADLAFFKLDHPLSTANILASEVKLVGVLVDFGTTLTSGFIV